MNILFIVDNFSPDLGAIAFRFEGIVKEAANRGHKVKVLASYPNRIDINRFNEFKYKNVEVIRINKVKLSTNTLQRAIVYVSYLYHSMKKGIKLTKNCDLIIATSPQLLVGVAGALISKICKKKFIIDIRDLWPDIVLDMKVMTKKNPIYIILKGLEKMMYKQSDFLIYNSPGFLNYLKGKYQNNKMELITNGIDDYILNYFSKDEILIEKKEKYQVLYAGNLGIAQDIKILVKLAKLYKEKIEINLIGKGSQEKEIREMIEKENLRNIKMIFSIPRKELLEKYNEVDILFLQLKDVKMFEKTIPSKIFEYLATQKPIVFGVEGVAKKIMCEDFKRKYYFKGNDIDSLNETFKSVIFDIENDKYIKPDVAKLKKLYSRERLSKKYVDIIETI